MLIDKYNRRIDYLRISVTDRCNLRCIYCMPADGIRHKPHEEILSFEEICKIVNTASGLGIQKIRITGGEPLVRKDLPLLIKELKGIKGLKEIALTTNGIYLNDCAHLLKRAGLNRVNISLDSLVPEKFQRITRGGNLADVLSGIEAALSAGLAPLKINIVLIKGFNTDEVLDFAILTKTREIHIRFIEYMSTKLPNPSFFSCGEAKNLCSGLGKLHPVDNGQSATAKIFRINNFCGTIGFISPLSEPFCLSCNKLRLTSDGRLKSCLHSSNEVNLKQAINDGVSEQVLSTFIKKAAALKPLSHNLLSSPLGFEDEDFSMCKIGG